jgi:hypothetical protein
MLMYAYNNNKNKKVNIIIWQIRERSQKYEVLSQPKNHAEYWDLFTQEVKQTANYSYQAIFCALVSMQISAQRDYIYLLR